jgi:hypothetical protein
VQIIRFLADGEPLTGVLDGDVITTVAAVSGVGGLLSRPLSEIREICAAPGGETVPREQAELLAPVDGRTEVWAAGVTYGPVRPDHRADDQPRRHGGLAGQHHHLGDRRIDQPGGTWQGSRRRHEERRQE